MLVNQDGERMNTIRVTQVDYTSHEQVQTLISLLDMYAQDPMGSGEPLPDDVKQRLAVDFPNLNGAISLVAWVGDEPVGFLNAFAGYSTFKAMPLLNVHDIAVLPAWRSRGVGNALLGALESHALDQGCCKITLEVLSGNTGARALYQRSGFEDYALNPQAGVAMFMQKWIQSPG